MSQHQPRTQRGTTPEAEVSVVRTVGAAVLGALGIAWMIVYVSIAADGEGLAWMADLGRWNFLIGFGLLFLGLAMLANPATPLGRGRGVVIGMLGCFLIGTAATEAARDAGVREALGGGLGELTRCFELRFRAARKSGEIAAAADPKLLADMASAVLFSLALRARAGHSRVQLSKFARQAVRMLLDG